jgi:uncharacterized protein (TIGR00290 family)
VPRVVLAWSGGKDSLMALGALRADPDYEILGLVTTVSAVYDRISIHGIRRSILAAQCASLGLPCVEAVLPADPSNDDYERVWAEALARAQRQWGEFSGVAYGDLYLADIRAYRDRQLAALGLATHYPLWLRDTTALARGFVAAGHEAYVTCVDTTLLDGAFAGRRYDDAFLAALPASVDACGENGEFHTCVVGGPLFAQSIAVTTGERVLREGRFQYVDLLPTP